LCKEKDERYQTMKEVLADLKSLKQQLELDSRVSLDHLISKDESAARRPFSYFREHKLAVIAVVVVVLGAATWMVKERLFMPPVKPLPFDERSWVLITNFDNRTGEAVFDGTLEYALGRELNNSQFVYVTPPERIDDALRLMKRPPDTRMDVTLGREVCLRDGGIRALLAGRADKLGSTYVLSISLIDPNQGQIVATHSEEASSQEQIAPAVRRLSNWVRESLGEALASIRQSNQELEKVTTPSLRALQLYTQAAAGHLNKGNAFAEQLYRQAIIEDPSFASAYIMLAWTLHNQRKPDQEWMQASERALQLSEQVSERERLFIAGSYHMMRDQDEMPSFEALVQRYPDDYWPTSNLAGSYQATGRYKEALVYRVKLAELRPNNFRAQANVVSLFQECRQMDDAFRYAKRANELITPELIKGSPNLTGGIEYILAIEPWYRGDYEKALGGLDRLAQTVDARDGRERDEYARIIGAGYLLFGKLKLAQEFTEKISPEGNRHFNQAILDFIRNNKARLRSDLLKAQATPSFRPLNGNESYWVPYLIRAGMLSEAEKIMSVTGTPGELKVYEGELALAHGQIEKAIPLLQAGVDSLQPIGGQLFLMAAYESLGSIYERQGDQTNQLGVLEESYRETSIGVTARVFWLKNAMKLMQLYRKLNRVEDTERVEAELSSTLRYADADHPILRQLKGS
jgi:tetratricopeptide (TPR) repeat protein